MLAPNSLSPTQLVVERDSLRRSLQELIRRRQSFTEKELARMNAAGVSFDPVTKQLRWMPANGEGDVAGEINAYQKALLVLLDDEAATLTAEELADAEANGVTGEELLAEIDEMIRQYHQQGNGR